MHQGALKAKNKVNLTFAKVKKKFLRKIPKCGIVATFMKKIENDEKGRYTFHHFTKIEFGMEIRFNHFRTIYGFE